jgi:hydrogenase maturation protease
MTPLLVIGYGNELRGDDGVGPRVARIVESWNRPDVRALAVHQLTPELAAELATADRVVFVDASVDSVSYWRTLTPTNEPRVFGHTSSPAWLLALSRELYDRAPEAWIATIQARDLGFDSKLTLEAERGVEEVLLRIGELTENQRSKTASTVVGSGIGTVEKPRF